MPRSKSAPGKPGIPPTWAASVKDMVTAALGPSRVWVTIGRGIVNEVYWPTTGRPQTHDLGFIVAGPAGWSEVKRVDKYRMVETDPFLPLPSILHEGDGYQLALDVVPDPLRDVVLISFRLSGEGLRLYVLLAPHCGESGHQNNATASDDLAAWRGPNAR